MRRIIFKNHMDVLIQITKIRQMEKQIYTHIRWRITLGLRWSCIQLFRQQNNCHMRLVPKVFLGLWYIDSLPPCLKLQNEFTKQIKQLGTTFLIELKYSICQSSDILVNIQLTLEQTLHKCNPIITLKWYTCVKTRIVCFSYITIETEYCSTWMFPTPEQCINYT